VSGATVYAQKSDAPMGKVPSAYTDKWGKFLIKVFASGIYTVAVVKEEDGYPLTDSPFHSVGPVDVPQVTVDEQKRIAEVVIKLGPKAARLVGRIVDANTNKPVENAQIILRRLNQNKQHWYTQATKEASQNKLSNYDLGEIA